MLRSVARFGRRHSSSPRLGPQCGRTGIRTRCPTSSGRPKTARSNGPVRSGRQRKESVIMADRFAPLTRLYRPAQWGVLLAASAVLAALLRLTGLPAALMLGPMIAAIFVGIGGGTIRVHHVV